MKITFNPTAANYSVLRQRIMDFKIENKWGSERIIKAAYAHSHLTERDNDYRHPLNRFIKGAQDRIDEEVAAALWRYFIEIHPSEILNHKKQNVDIFKDRFAHALSDFYDVDSQEMAELYSDSIDGRFQIIREAWRPRFKRGILSVGLLKFDIPKDQNRSVIAISELSSLEDINNNPDMRYNEIAKGYAILKGTNFNCFLRTSSGYPKFYTVEEFNPTPEKGQKGRRFKSFHGSVYATIGNGPHASYRFYARRLNANESSPIGVLKIENIYDLKYSDYEIDLIKNMMV